jgi:hypothetical protein
MDPTSALGIAASIVQFVEFASRLISRGYQISQSENGDLVNQDRKCIAENLATLSTGLNNSLELDMPNRELTKTEKELRRFSDDCNDMAEKLLDALQKLKASSRNQGWKVFQEALLTLWNEKTIGKMQWRLQEIRQQLVINILASLRCEPGLSAY